MPVEKVDAVILKREKASVEYLVQFSGGPTEDSFNEFTVKDAVAVPRAGEAIEIDERVYTVVYVAHVVSNGIAGPIAVRVR
ncbi:MAG: hypothetical protein ACOY0T_18345 [Myxococcota bacterium]